MAVDGERELMLGAGGGGATLLAVVTLRADGPRCIDVPATLAHPAATTHRLVTSLEKETTR